jgi:hypothetical protein
MIMDHNFIRCSHFSSFELLHRICIRVICSTMSLEDSEILFLHIVSKLDHWYMVPPVKTCVIML